MPSGWMVNFSGGLTNVGMTMFATARIPKGYPGKGRLHQRQSGALSNSDRAQVCPATLGVYVMAGQ